MESKRVPFREDFSKKACDARREWAEYQTGTSLKGMGTWIDGEDPSKFKGNIELPIGTIKMPVAAVGPLTFNGEAAQGDFIAPFATTEGALTASVMRGAMAINAGSGVVSWTGQQHVSRSPMFLTRNPKEAIMLGNWVQKQVPLIQEEVVRKHSGFAMLQSITPIYDMEVSTFLRCHPKSKSKSNYCVIWPRKHYYILMGLS